MTIDIIDLTSPEYANLNAVQMSMVRAAQTKKNEIMAKMDEELLALRHMMLANNTVRSTAYAKECEVINAKKDEEIATVKEDLLYQLAYESLQSEGNGNGPYRYPENPNYNLMPSQRFLVVRNYYMNVEQEPNARLEAYAMDTLAREYLGEFYQTLYEILASYC